TVHVAEAHARAVREGAVFLEQGVADRVHERHAGLRRVHQRETISATPGRLELAPAIAGLLVPCGIRRLVARRAGDDNQQHCAFHHFAEERRRSSTLSPTHRPSAFPFSFPMGKWIPPRTRDSAAWSAASWNELKRRGG